MAVNYTPENVFTDAGNAEGADQLTAVNDILAKSFSAVVDFLYSIVSVLLDFFTKPEVLGVLVAIILIFTGYKWFKRKKLG